MSLRDTMIRLQALASHPSAPEGERKAALTALKRLRQANPHIDPETPPEEGRQFRYKQWQEEMLLRHVGWYLGLRVFSLTSKPAKRKLKRLELRGDPRLLAVVDQLMKDYGPRLQETLEFATRGWMTETFPLPPVEPKEGVEVPKLSQEQLDAYRMGLRLGKRHQGAQYELGGSPELEDGE